MIERINRGMLALGATACILMMLHICLDVLAKYLFHAPIPLTLEIVSIYYMVSLVFLPMAYTEQQDGHISVDIVAAQLSPRRQRLMRSLAELLSALFLAVACWQTALDAWGKFLIRETSFGSIAMPSWPSYLLVPAGYGLAAVVFARKGWKGLRGGDEAPRHD